MYLLFDNYNKNQCNKYSYINISDDFLDASLVHSSQTVQYSSVWETDSCWVFHRDELDELWSRTFKITGHLPVYVASYEFTDCLGKKNEKSEYAKVGRNSCTIAAVLMMALACPYLSALYGS